MLCMIQKYMVDLLAKALNEEEGQAVKVEQIDTITDGSLQVNVYKFRRQEKRSSQKNEVTYREKKNMFVSNNYFLFCCCESLPRNDNWHR